jgi:LysM repeat protein
VRNTVVYCILCILFLAALPMVAQVPAGTPKVTVSGTEYYKYTVEKGIGLYRIAINFGVSQDDIIKANPSAAQGLAEGQTLLIPMATNISKAQVGITHTVEKGQTLYSIAQKYAVSVAAITERNPSVQEGLKEGMVLSIPQGEDFRTESLGTRTDTKGYTLHTVQEKETLYGIGGKYNIPVEQILNDNPGLHDSGLQAGAVVRIKNSAMVAKAEPANATPVNAQQVPTNYELMHFHKTMGGENYHFISRKYQVAYNDLVEANPTIDPDKLEVGTIVAVPINPLSNNELLGSFWYSSHKVGKRETLYGISKMHNCPVETIQMFNPNVDLKSLTKGQTLYLPTSDWMEASRLHAEAKSAIKKVNEQLLVVNDCNGFNYFANKSTINIAVLLPFNVQHSGAQTTMVDNSASTSDGSGTVVEQNYLSGRTKMVVEFYEGILMGVNRWKEKGVNIKLMAFDTGIEASDINKVLDMKEVQNADLIIGPAYPQHIKAVSDFSVKHKIKMVAPFSGSYDEVYNNPLLFLTSTVDSLATDKMAKYLIEKSANSKLVLVKSAAGSVPEANMQAALRKYQALMGTNLHVELSEMVFSRTSPTGISAQLSREKNNIVVVPSESEVFVGQVLIGLDAIAERNQYPLEVYGMAEWLKFQTVDPESFHRMNGRLFTNHAFDYESAVTKQFITEFRALYSSEPVAFTPLFQPNVAGSAYNRYGALGYDLSYFFVGAMVGYGKSFETCLSRMESSNLIQSEFKFNRISNWGGFYNSGLFELQFNKDLTTKRVVVE